MLFGAVVLGACGRSGFDQVDASKVGDAIGDAIPGGGSIARVQRVPVANTPIECGGNSCQATFPAPTVAGDLVAVLVTTDGPSPATITSVVDNQGSSQYALAISGTIEPSQFGLAAIYYRANVPAASQFAVTVTTDGQWIDVALVEYSGIGAAAPTTSKDQCLNACSAVDVAPPTGGMSLALFTTDNSNVDAMTMAGGWNELANEPYANNAIMGAGDLIGGGSIPASWSMVTPQPWVAVAATFGP